MPIRERVLVMGPYDAGKSHQWLTMAKWLRPTGAQFYCIDSDDAIEYMLKEKKQFQGLSAKDGGNVHVHAAYEYDEFIAAQKKIAPLVVPQDWVILDMMEMPWKKTSDYFVLKLHEETKAEYLLDARKKMLAVGDKTSKGKEAQLLSTALQGRKDWPVINAFYDEFIMPIVYQWKCHVYATTRADEISKDDDPETISLFKGIGLKPAGQKALGHQFHSIFLFTHTRGTKQRPKGTWHITTVKERGDRPYFFEETLTDLYMQYMVDRAGWDIP